MESIVKTSILLSCLAITSTLHAQGPDLVLRSFQFQGFRGGASIQGEFKVRYQNDSTSPTNGFTIRIWEDSVQNGCTYDPGRDVLLGVASEPGPVPGEFASSAIIPIPTRKALSSNQSIPICAWIDADSLIPETIETNNIRSLDSNSLPPIPVDAELVLSTDVSGSIDANEYRLQMQGYARAFRDPAFHQIIASGRYRRIAVVLNQWSSITGVAVPWTSIHSVESALAFADLLESVPRLFAGNTDPSLGIRSARALFATNDFAGLRKVIDLSGDGVGSSELTLQERDIALREIDAINGLAISDPPNTTIVYNWYRQNVPGGRYSFVIPANDFEAFQQAVLLKLRMELAQPSEVISDLSARTKSGGVDLRWSPIRRAVAYNIYRRSGIGPLQLIRANHLSSLAAFSDEGLTDGLTYAYVVRWLDSSGAESDDSTEITGTPSPRVAGQMPPTITSVPIVRAFQNTPYSYQTSAADPDTGEILTYSLESAPAGMNITSGGRITWDTSTRALGSYLIKWRVSDKTGRFATQQFRLVLTLQQVEHPPVITSTPPPSATAGTTYFYDVNASDENTPNGLVYALDTIRGSQTSLYPSGMTINAMTGLIQWTPSPTQIGTQNVRVLVTDPSGLTATQSFSIVVGTNQAPLITSVPVTNAAPGVQYSYQVTATDPENHPLQYSLTQFPLGMSITPSTGVISWLPGISFGGTIQPITVVVTDLGGRTTNQSFTISVVPADTQRPLVSILTPTNGASINGDIQVSGTVTDANLRLWRLEYRPVNAGPWIPIASGATQVVNGPLGELPATLLGNDVYQLRIYAEDIVGSNTAEIEIAVNTRQLKMGDFTADFEDLRVSGFTFPISITRKYDSKRPQSVDFGPGWALSFGEVDVRRDANYNIFLTLPDGRRVRFRYTPTPAGLGVFNTAFTADGGVYDTLENVDCPLVFGAPPNPLCGGFTTWNPQSWRLRTKEGITYEIMGSAIRRMTDRNGNWLEITPTGITSNTGRNVVIARDFLGRITRITPPSGGQLRYEYDAAGRLSRYLDENGKATTFQYGDTLRTHYLTRIMDALGRVQLQNIFNPEGRLIAQCDADDNVATLAGCRQFTYVPGTKTINAVNGRGFRSELITDERGNVLRERRFKDAVSFEDTVRTYDANDNLLSEVDPGGGTRLFTYDARGNRLTETDPGGRTTRYTWHPTCSKPQTVTDPASRVTTSTYDARCNLTSVEDALRGTTNYEYNTSGQQTRMVDPEGTAWIWSYLPNGLLERVTDPFGKVISFSFDNRGNLLSRLDRNGRRINFEYDAAGRLTKETWSNGKITDYLYDETGALTGANDGETRLTMTYDGLGRLRSVSNVNSASAPLSVLTYDYDGNGNVSGLTESPVKWPFSTPWTVQYDYDFRDRLVRAASKMQQHSFSYSLSGLRTQAIAEARYYSNPNPLEGGTRIDVPAIRTSYEYDCSACPDRLTAIRYRRFSDNSVLHDFAFQRDVVGNITSMVDRLGTHSFSYDPLRRLTSAIHPPSSTQPAESYNYDDAGNRETSHLSAFYTLQRNRLLQDARSTYVYDDEGNLVRKTDSASGEVTEYGYDHRNRMTSVVVRNSANTILRYGIYSYDAFNRRSRINEGRGDIFYIYDGMNAILRTRAVPNLPTLSYRLYSRALDDVLGEEMVYLAAGFSSRFFIKDQVGTVRDIYEHYSSANGQFYFANRYTYDSFGQELRREPSTMFERGQWGAEYPNDLLFTSREFSPVSGLGYFRARSYAQLLGRFKQEDWYEPFGYAYVSGNPLNLIDPEGETEDATLLSSIGIRASSALRSVGHCVAIGVVPKFETRD
jgi:RHS repeat-associated protein